MERTIKPENLKPALAGKHVIDVRRKADHDASSEALPGAAWHDPEKLAEWADTLPKDKEVVVYCVKGGAVSQSVASSLQEINPNVRFLEGGILGWEEKQK